MGVGGAEYFSAMASADAAHARKDDTAAEISGFDLKCGDDLRRGIEFGGERKGERAGGREIELDVFSGGKDKQ